VNLDAANIAALLPFEARYERRRRLWLDGPHAGWLAYDRALQREVILNIAYRPADASRVVESARILAALRHRSIPPLLGLGITDEGLPYFTTPPLEGVALDSLLERLKGAGDSAAEPFPLRPLAGVVREVCRAVEYARGRGVVNPDIYPGCILVGPDFRDVLVSGGWERARDEEEANEGLARVGSLLCYLAYVSPERVRDPSRTVTPASDAYNLGGMLHLILYGIPPNHLPGSKRAIELFQAIAVGKFDARTPGELRPEIRPQGFLGRRAVRHLERICLKALASDLEQRHRNAGELERDLDTWLGLP
jgi:serine/threonine protein kinase